MKDHANILVGLPDAGTVEAICTTLEGAGHTCSGATDPEQVLSEARSGRYDVLITSVDSDDGMAVLQAARRSNPPCQVIVVATGGDAAQAVAAMRRGALYYLQTPVDPFELTAIVDRTFERVVIERDREALQNELAGRYGLDNIIGRSPPMRRVLRKINQIAPTSATVLIYGETGTGKELVARAIHYKSPRRHNRFAPLNCAGLVESILESELFGHVKGAFTGAANTRVGVFEFANNGTLFLDEIGDMPPSTQTKLLRALERGEIVRVGTNEAMIVDVRVVAATNQDLQQKIRDGTFRQDLFYRLNVMAITLPPLRERQGDIPLLVERFVRDFSDLYDKPVRGISANVRKALFRYNWPGNVRELRNCIEHMIVATVDEVLDEDDLPEYMPGQPDTMLDGVPPTGMAGQPLEEVEKRHIARTLEIVNGNRERAAELLGIGERTLYRKIQKYDLR